MSTLTRPPLPPFSAETATLKVQAAAQAWNSRDPIRVAAAYTEDCQWRNRDQFINGREKIEQLLAHKWSKELNYRLKKELWAFTNNRIAVTFLYEWQDTTAQWFRSHGNELWQFSSNGLMERRIASINDLPIKEAERQLI